MESFFLDCSAFSSENKGEGLHHIKQYVDDCGAVIEEFRAQSKKKIISIIQIKIKIYLTKILIYVKITSICFIENLHGQTNILV